MRFSTFFIATVLSAGALSAPTESSDYPVSELDDRGVSWGRIKPWIGMYDNDQCKGNGIKNGRRPKLDGRKCKLFVHNRDMNATFPFLKIEFGQIISPGRVRFYSDTHCEEQLGVDLFRPKSDKEHSVCINADKEGYYDIGSVAAW